MAIVRFDKYSWLGVAKAQIELMCILFALILYENLTGVQRGKFN